VVVGSAPHHALTTNENKPPHARFQGWWAQYPAMPSPPMKMSSYVLVFGGGGLSTLPCPHHQ